MDILTDEELKEMGFENALEYVDYILSLIIEKECEGSYFYKNEENEPE